MNIDELLMDTPEFNEVLKASPELYEWLKALPDDDDSDEDPYDEMRTVISKLIDELRAKNWTAEEIVDLIYKITS